MKTIDRGQSHVGAFHNLPESSPDLAGGDGGGNALEDHLAGCDMTKSELIDAIAGRGELTKARAELVVNCIFDAMTEALQRGEGIEIRGFGSFTVRPYKPYSGRNPRTGQPVPVPAKRLPFFKVGKELKELVNNSREFAITGDVDGSDDDDDDLEDDEDE